MIRWISFLLTALIILIANSLQSSRQITVLRRLEINRYQQALSELDETLDSLNVTLQKSSYVHTAYGLNNLCNELNLLSATANTCLGNLPAGEEGVRQLTAFFAKVGDYSATLSAEAVCGHSMSEEQLQALLQLAQTTEKLSQKTDELKTLYNQANVWQSYLNGQNTAFVTALNETEQSLSNQPSLVYDGPFSDHINNKEAQMLKGAAAVSKEKALQRAADALKVNPSVLSFAGEEKGTMPA